MPYSRDTRIKTKSVAQKSYNGPDNTSCTKLYTAATLFKRPQSEISFKRQRDEDFDTHIPVLKKLKLDRKSNKRKSEETIENQTNKRLRSSLDNWVSY